MTATVTIKVKKSKTVKTKYGEKTKYDLLCIGKSGTETWVSVWGGQETDGWREGQEVSLELEKNEYNGKTFWNGKPLSKGGGATAELENRVGQIMSELLEVKAVVTRILALFEAAGGGGSGGEGAESAPPTSEDEELPF